METILLALLTTTLFAVLGLGFHVFSVAPGRPENRAFAAFAWIMALWIVNDIAFWCFHGPDEDGTTWAQAAFLISLALQLAFLRFAWIFPDPRPVPWGRAAPLLLGTAALVPVIAGGWVIGPVGFTDGVFSIRFTPWTFVVGGWVYAMFLLARLILPRAGSRADPTTRRQLRLLTWAAWGTGALTTLSVVVLPLAGVHALLPFASIGILLGTVIHGYAMSRFRLFRPESVLDRIRFFPVTAKLAVAVAACSLATALIVLGVTWLSVGAASGADLVAWKRAVVLALTVSSIPAMGLILLAQRLVTRPLRAITEAAIEVGDGRTDVRVVVGEARDEVGVLAASFNEMVERLEREIGALRDMTEGLQRTERLATAGALAAGVAHEVNNPLAAVSSLVQTARERVDDERARDLLEEAVAQMERVAAAMRELMDFARPRAEVRRRCSIDEIARATTRLLRYDRRFREVDLRTELAPGLPEIDADPDRIQQVLLNLLLNARDAVEGRDPARIDLATRAEEGGVAVEVADTGRGIAPEQAERVFEFFFTTKRPGAGTGLGLAVCQQIVREHGGRIGLQSEPGRGTRVRVWLPPADRPAPAADEAAAGAAEEKSEPDVATQSAARRG